VVIAIVALASAAVTLAVRDPQATQLEREAARLSALLESARAEARASGLAVFWVPAVASAGVGRDARSGLADGAPGVGRGDAIGEAVASRGGADRIGDGRAASGGDLSELGSAAAGRALHVGDSAQAARPPDFRFVGLPPAIALPRHWLVPGVSAVVVGSTALQLGPEPLIPAQRVVLSLGPRRLVLATDGLAPFAVEGDALGARTLNGLQGASTGSARTDSGLRRWANVGKQGDDLPRPIGIRPCDVLGPFEVQVGDVA
jgi:general secretion pathway protein H